MIMMLWIRKVLDGFAWWVLRAGRLQDEMRRVEMQGEYGSSEGTEVTQRKRGIRRGEGLRKCS